MVIYRMSIEIIAEGEIRPSGFKPEVWPPSFL